MSPTLGRLVDLGFTTRAFWGSTAGFTASPCRGSTFRVAGFAKYASPFEALKVENFTKEAFTTINFRGKAASLDRIVSQISYINVLQHGKAQVHLLKEQFLPRVKRPLFGSLRNNTYLSFDPTKELLWHVILCVVDFFLSRVPPKLLSLC